MGVHGPGRLVAAFAFMLSPYFLQYVGRISVILLPYAALPWLIALAARSVRTRGWRFPALFALVWLSSAASTPARPSTPGWPRPCGCPTPCSSAREARWRDAWAAAWRIALLTVLVSLWWVAALAVEGGYGLNILKYTETVQTVAATSLASEVLRGLGYWYFYDGDELGQWVSTSVQFTQQLWLIALSFAVPAGRLPGGGGRPLAGPGLLRPPRPHRDGGGRGGPPLREGTIVSKAHQDLHDPDRGRPGPAVDRPGHPDGDPRSGHAARGRRHRPLPARAGWPGCWWGWLALGLVVAADPPVFNGTTVADHFTQPSPLPPLRDRDGQGPERRAHRAPGCWPSRGRTSPPTATATSSTPSGPGLLTRPFVTREQQALGSLASYDLLYGLDNPMQNGIVEPDAIAPLARLMSAGDVLVQNDLAYERYNSPRPLQMAVRPHPHPGRAVGPGRLRDARGPTSRRSR